MIRDNTVVVTGLAKTVGYLEHCDEGVKRVLHDELDKAAEPVRDEARRLFQEYSYKSAAGYQIRSDKRGMVQVFQSLKPTTGDRPRWGALQMREALLPALDRKSEEVGERMNETIGTILEKL